MRPPGGLPPLDSARKSDWARERLMLFNLPGTAAEDMALAAGRPARTCEDLDAQLAAIRDRVMQALEDLPPNPLHGAQTDEAAVNSCQEGDNDED